MNWSTLIYSNDSTLSVGINPIKARNMAVDECFGDAKFIELSVSKRYQSLVDDKSQAPLDLSWTGSSAGKIMLEVSSVGDFIGR